MEYDRVQPGSFLYPSGTVQEDNVRVETFCEEDSDSGSWWSYPSECGSVVDVYRGLTSREEFDSLRSCMASLDNGGTPQMTALKISDGQPRRSPAVAPLPDRPRSRCARVYSVDLDSLDAYNRHIDNIKMDNNKSTGHYASNEKEVRHLTEARNTGQRSVSVLADEKPLNAPSSVRHVTFKEASASSGSEEDDYCARNRNWSCRQGNAKHMFPLGPRDTDLDDSGYLDGESTSSSSDVSPPGSLAWESSIDRRGFAEVFPEEPSYVDRGNEFTTSDISCAENGHTTDMNDFTTISTGYITTELTVSEVVRREDGYEYVRNDTRIAKLNNIHQSSWTKTSSSTAPYTPTDQDYNATQQQTTVPKTNRDAILQAGPTRHVAPSTNGRAKPEAEIPPRGRQSAERESEEKQKRCTSNASEVTRPEKVEDYRGRRGVPGNVFDAADEGTSCDYEDDVDAVDYAAFNRNGRRDVNIGTPRDARVSATATSRAVARNRDRNADEPCSVSALASARVEGEDPYLALAVATAKAATTASVEASNEIYAKRKAFCAPPDLDVIIQTACSVAGDESLPGRAQSLRGQSGPGVVVVPNPPPRTSSPRRDVRPGLPTPVRYNEFSALNLKSPVDMNGESMLAREPLETHAFQVHTVWTSSDEAPSPASSARSTPTRCSTLREDRVRAVRTPVKGTAVVVQDVSDSDDVQTEIPKKSTAPSPPYRAHQNGHHDKPAVNGRHPAINIRPATLPVNGKPPLPNGRSRAKTACLPLPSRPKFLDAANSSEEYLERITGFRTAKKVAEILPKPQVILPAPSPGTRLVSSRRRFFESLQREAKTTRDDAAERLEHFKASTQEARECLAKSSPDIAALEADVRSRRGTDRYRGRSAAPVADDQTTAFAHKAHRPVANEDRFASTVEKVRQRYPRYVGNDAGPDLRRRSKSLGYLETDVDTLQCRNVNEVIADEENADEASSPLERTRSMDFLMQEENRSVVTPPENDLASARGRAKSEHELRVEKSLQNLQLPEWYTKYCAQSGQSPSSSVRPSRAESVRSGGWQGLGSRTPSSTSLSLNAGRNLVIPKRVTPDWRTIGAHDTSRESLTSSPGWASPHDGSLSRWGSVSSAPGSAWSYRSFRQPYLGWRAAAAATPSTGTATPMSTSRPVSPGGPLLSDAGGIPRDRYSYIQGIYGGGNWNVNYDTCRTDAATSEVPKHEVSTESANVKPVWMESSFVGARPEGNATSTTSCTVEKHDEPSDPNKEVRKTSGREFSSQEDVTLEDMLSSLLALSDISPSHSSRLETPSKTATLSPISPEIRHVCRCSPAAQGPSPDVRGERRGSEGARPSTPISILKQDGRFLTSQDTQDTHGSVGNIHLTVPQQTCSSGSSNDHSPEIVIRQDTPRHVTTEPTAEPFTDDANLAATTTTTVDTSDPESASQTTFPDQPAMVKCQWNLCQRILATDTSGKVKVHTCPTCYSYFCSRVCRTHHRESRRCPFTRVSNLCQEVLQKIRHDPTSRHHLSVCAQRGLMSRGRGVVRMVFHGPQKAAQFLEGGWDSVRGQMFYIPRTDLLPHDMGARVYAQVRSLCDDYDPDRKFVLLVAVCVTQEVNTPAGISAISREMVVKAMKLRLTSPLPEDDVQTLILPVVPPPAGTNGVAPQHRQRLQGLRQVEKQLETRGVHLARHYPDIYAKIREFVDGGEAFSPVSMFPTDSRTGRIFMCIVLPWADQELQDKMAASWNSSTNKNCKKWIF
ncbi:uncharacterized protein LOC135368918 isoform X2 [Ornithodoros turicata]|uniref:uncharacterized protein LOC135368918 isoform X2 n=1 Tax=Ornithodoros turicata TaxID=34597 RepID=UPI00313A1A84